MADWQAEARRTAQRVGVDPDLYVALVRQESGGNAAARSPAGAIGYSQLMPATARGLGVDPNDPAQNLYGGALYLKQQLQAFGGNRAKALAAYNAGPGAVRAAGGVPNIAETQHYVKTILGSLGSGAGSDFPATNEAPAPAVAALTSADPGQSAAPLLQLASASRQVPPSSTLQAPAATAGPAIPEAFKALSATQGPAPRQDVSALISAAATPGQATSTASVAGTGAPVAASQPSKAANPTVDALKAEAQLINDAKVPYLWGGGHAAAQPRGSKVTPLDCSGAVSRVLGINPRVASQFETWGQAGDGGKSGVTIYAKDTHVLMKINGHFFGTSSTNPGGGAGWIKQSAISPDYLKSFTARHL